MIRAERYGGPAFGHRNGRRISRSRTFLDALCAEMVRLLRAAKDLGSRLLMVKRSDDGRLPAGGKRHASDPQGGA